MKRDGMVLMMTLLLIAVLMGLSALVLTQSEKLSRLGNDTFSKSSSMKIVNDLQKQLPSLLYGINTAEELDLTMRLPLQLESKNRDFIMKMQFSSPYGRLNINTLVDSDGKINESKTALFNRIFSIYSVTDSDILIKLVSDTIDTDTSERGEGTEISISNPDVNNGKIANFEQFNHILERYVELTRDTSVLSIPWDRYIGFEGDKMDFNALNPETLTLILPTVSAEKIRSLTLFRTKAYVSKEEAIAAEPALASVFDNHFFIYTSGIAYNLLCDLHVTENAHEEHIRFQYNLLEKKVKHVEFL
ncbi:hypothetical protein [Sulfuricurvum sp.]|uniref:hypothetical protein n=1 Tax=Sulfuricurvum sp. TaxID=2025608 RepID=UPI002E317E7B|nr:hypothetical protein [Sulfuricurvum sp.]HEX5330206.1 hypothetical protein [Sulfuricurvum sp.]